MTVQSLAENRHGFAVLNADALDVREALERRVRQWADAEAAEEMHYPPLIRVEDLQRFDYFTNFPHLGICACGLRGDRRQAYADDADTSARHAIPARDLADADFVLLPAACYNVYLSFQAQTLDGPRAIGTVAQCYRNEDYVRGLERLRGFTMREVVHIGDGDSVQAFLTRMRGRIAAFAEAIGLPLTAQRASDPFFDKQSERALMAQLFPTKEEFVYGDDLAIASVNYHRNFFGERCDIHYGGAPAHTGCVAFGLERWLHALIACYGGDSAAIVAAIDGAPA